MAAGNRHPRDSRSKQNRWRAVWIALCCLTVLTFVYTRNVQAGAATSAELQTDYKQTGNLTEADKADDYQKNYTTAPGSSGSSYVYKSAEWVNKEQGTAQIQVYAKFPQSPHNSCVYIMETCSAHGFTKDIGKRNINYLRQYYDRVDVVINNGCNWDQMLIYTDVQDATCLDDATYKEDRHSSSWMYGALVKYFMGSENSTTQINFPSTVYMSMDEVTLSEGSIMSTAGPNVDYVPYCRWCTENGYSYNMSVWPILEKYADCGRYIMMSEYIPRTYTTTQPVGTNDGDFYRMMDPGKWDVPSFSATVKYCYQQDFETAGIPLAPSAALKDTVSSDFVVIDASCTTGNVNIEGNAVSTEFPSTYAGEEVVMTINVQLITRQMTDWMSTNSKNVYINGTDGNRLIFMEAASPKLYKGAPLLCVSKTCIDSCAAYSRSSYPDLTYPFTIYNQNGTIVTESLSGTVYTDGVVRPEVIQITDGTFSLKENQYIIIAGLPAGTYHVTEDETGKFWSCRNAVSQPGVPVADDAVYTEGYSTNSFTLVNDYRTDIAYRNYYNAPVLIVQKTIQDSSTEGDLSADAEFSFTVVDENGNPVQGTYECIIVSMEYNTVLETRQITDGTFTLKRFNKAYIRGLSAGNYKVIEANAGNRWWTQHVTKAPGDVISDTDTYTNGLDSEMVTLVEGLHTEAGFLNHYTAVRDLQLQKSVIGIGAPADATFTYEFRFVKEDGNPLTGNIVYTGTGGAPGGTITLDSKGRGSVSGIPNGGTVTFAGIPVGSTYYFHETSVTAGGVTTPVTTDWSAKWYIAPTVAQQTKVIKYVFQNNTRTTVTAAYGYTLYPTVLVSVIPSSSASVTFTFPAGCTISNVGNYGTTTTTLNPAVDRNVGNTNMVHCTVSGTSVIVSFNVAYFSILAQGNTGNRVYLSLDVTYPPENVYTSANSGTGTQMSGTMALQDNILVYQNAYAAKTGLTVTKHVEAQNGGTAPTDKTYSFQLQTSAGASVTGSHTYTVSGPSAADASYTTTNGTFTLKDGETAAFTDLTVGSYRVVETSPGADWQQQCAVSTAGGSLGSYSTGNIAAVTLSDKKTTQAAFKNIYNPAKITVSKTVTGAPPDADETFEFTLTKAGQPVAGAAYTVTGDPSVRHTDSSGHLYLKNGQTAEIVNLASDTSANAYKVTETANPEYVATSTGGGVNLPVSPGGTGTVSYTNAYAQSTADLTLSKTVQGGAPADATFLFYVTVRKPDGSPRTGTYAYSSSDGSSGTVTLNSIGKGYISGIAGGQTVTIHGLFVGDTYTYTERSVTTGGVTTVLAGEDTCTTTWKNVQKLIIPMNGSLPAPVNGYVLWNRTITSYMVPNVEASAVISDIPAVPAGATVRLLSSSAGGAAPDPGSAGEEDLSSQEVLTASVNAAGGIDLTAQKNYVLNLNSAYSSTFSRIYLYIDYGTAANSGRTSSGTILSGSGTEFINSYAQSLKTLTVVKKVKGDLADPLQSFSFRIRLSTAGGNADSTAYSCRTYTMSGTTPDPASDTAASDESTVTDNGTFQLKDNQYIVIRGLAGGEKYTVEEQGASDYATTVTAQNGTGDGSPVSGKTAGEKTIEASEDAVNQQIFINTKNNVTPTGIRLDALPYLLLGAFVLAAGAAMRMFHKKSRCGCRTQRPGKGGCHDIQE